VLVIGGKTGVPGDPSHRSCDMVTLD
jgi:hypothetical protein